MNTYPRGVNKKVLKSGAVRYVAQYTKNKHHYQKTFATLNEAIHQRKDWEKQYGMTSWGNKPPKDLTGATFGKLTVTGYAGSRDGYGALWDCVCSCGKTLTVRGDHLKRGRLKSCGHVFDQMISTVAEKGRQAQEKSKVENVMLHRFSDKPFKHNTTGYRGVSKSKGTYRARLTVDGQTYVKTGFETPEDAYYNGRIVLEEHYLPKKST